ncbi:MAG: TraB/GumN family protein [Methanomicrobiaceae archaeon]|nr:TraB/GumN family protein [Methanomicrobiaceae archaeon]
MSEIRLVGTAHVSQKSIDEVHAAIEEFIPDIVAVELDPPRYAALKKEGREASVDEILRAGQFSQLLVQWLLAYIQRRIGADVGVEPGAEMLAAIQAAEEQKIPVALVDRDLRLTLKRFWRMMSLWEKIKIFGALIVSITGYGRDEIDVDTLTQQDVLSAALEEFRHFSPRGAQALIDERDAFIAHRLLALSRRHERILGVVGAGHVQGVLRYLQQPETLPSMEKLTQEPHTLPWARFLGFGIAILFTALLILIGFSGVGLSVLGLALLYWVLINGVPSAVCALLAGGHPLSALTAFGVSWLTSLNPLMAAGWFAAITEARIRKPSAADFRGIIDAESFGELWKVPLFRVVLVAAITNLGSTIGTIAYFIFIFPVLGIDPGVVIVQGAENFLEFILGLLRL